MTDPIPFINPVSVSPHVPDVPDVPDAHDTPDVPTAKKVTITDRDDAYLAALLGNDLDIYFEGGDIRGYTPPVPTSTREWLLLALAAKLNKYRMKIDVFDQINSVGAPKNLHSTDSLEAAIETINSIINCLIDAGVFRIDAIPFNPGQPGYEQEPTPPTK